MNDKLILPPNYIEVDNKPTIFLAGPIQGAPDWHSKAIQIIQDTAPDVYIACPKAPDTVFENEMTYEKQVNWETHFLNKAANNGVILFWLAEETNHMCDRAYAQTTRFELAEWKVKHQFEGTNVVIGIHLDFPGRRYIKKRITDDCPAIPILNTLEDTCLVAIKKNQRK